MYLTQEQICSFLASLGLQSGQVQVAVKHGSSEGRWVEETLAIMYPNSVEFPGTLAYDDSVKGNWSAVARRNASAVFHPSSPEQVSYALRLLEFFEQPFAVRGGGHSPNPEWASIDGGLLVSTDRLNYLKYNEVEKTASIGAGNRWGMVYRYLEKFGVLVTGGHSAPVGCVGQITGCGNSPWFHKYGWSCDNVFNFQVVTSGGRIVNANKDENADLWWALKGGSNNFGIVTRLDMTTIPVPGGVWGGSIRWEHSPEMQRKTVEAYYKFQMEAIAEDSGVESLSGWGKYGAKKYIQKVLSADRAVADGGNPKPFDGFFDLKPTAMLAGNCLPSQLAAHDDPAMLNDESRCYFSDGTRSSMLCLVTKADLGFYQEAVDIFYDAYKQSDKTMNAVACLNMSPIAAKTIRMSNERGGTPCGWAEVEQSIVFLDNAWLREQDDKLMFEMGDKCIARLRAAAEARGVLMPQIWMNNAGPDDDVIASYGKANWNRLQEISVKYDPKRTFQRLCRGGYKIERE
ncbi:hypothetical protein BJX62DRAFT_241439 [Aspergillus germanicus]